jgi:hypothetical protein
VRGSRGVPFVPHVELQRVYSAIGVWLIESSKLAGWGAPRDSHEACRRRDPQHSPPTETDRDGVVPGHRKWRRHGTRAGVSWSFLRPPPRASTGLLYYWRAVDRIVEASGMGHPEWHPSTRRRPLAQIESARSQASPRMSGWALTSRRTRHRDVVLPCVFGAVEGGVGGFDQAVGGGVALLAQGGDARTE